ncbi:hypothetical protein LCL97_15820 [Seohaeicola saemankumensis]|nr:hypothetical protein [Seohaeicola saemankumensis]MCA0872303.1 hypothetical protein [Seohaeicola saemankumensis]
MTTSPTEAALNPLAPDHLPSYIVSADGSDHLLTVMIIFTLALILGIGLLYLTLHALPEKMGHHANHSQMQIIGILALLALFTHNNAFWVIALLVAAFRPPDFLTPLRSISRSLDRLSRGAVAAGPVAGVATGAAAGAVSDDASAPAPSEQTQTQEKEG